MTGQNITRPGRHPPINEYIEIRNKQRAAHGSGRWLPPKEYFTNRTINLKDSLNVCAFNIHVKTKV
jgi:hypothetical protein